MPPAAPVRDAGLLGVLGFPSPHVLVLLLPGLGFPEVVMTDRHLT
jgi:hypothetical protein